MLFTRTKTFSIQNKCLIFKLPLENSKINQRCSEFDYPCLKSCSDIKDNCDDDCPCQLNCPTGCPCKEG